MDLFTKRLRIVVAAVLLITAAYFSCLLISDDENLLSDMPEKEYININTATAEDFMQFEGVGEKIAKRIIEYREENGDFEKIEDIMNVDGIGEKFFETNKYILIV